MKLPSFRLCDIHVAQIIKTNNAIENGMKHTAEAIVFLCVPLFSLFSAVGRFTVPFGFSLADGNEQSTNYSCGPPWKLATAFTALGRLS